MNVGRASWCLPFANILTGPSSDLLKVRDLCCLGLLRPSGSHQLLRVVGQLPRRHSRSLQYCYLCTQKTEPVDAVEFLDGLETSASNRTERPRTRHRGYGPFRTECARPLGRRQEVGYLATQAFRACHPNMERSSLRTTVDLRASPSWLFNIIQDLFAEPPGVVLGGWGCSWAGLSASASAVLQGLHNENEDDDERAEMSR